MITARRPLHSAVSGNALTAGCMAAGKCDDEKNTPDSTNIGSITRFISPLIVSLFWARLATRIAMPAKQALPVTLTRTSASHDPAMRTSNASRAKIRMHAKLDRDHDQAGRSPARRTGGAAASAPRAGA